MVLRKQKENVVYSDKFRDVVLRAYPENDMIRELLDSNAYFLGRFLDDGCSCSGRVTVGADEIVIAIGSGKTKEFMDQLLEKANKEKLRSLAYKMWGEEWFDNED